MPIVRPPRLQIPRMMTAETLENRTHFAIDPASFPMTYGGASGFDNVQKIVPTSDGGFVAAGLFSSRLQLPGLGSIANVSPHGIAARGDSDIYVAKFNSQGLVEWYQQIGGDATDRVMTDFDERDLPINPRNLYESVGKVGDQPRAAGEYVNDIAIDAAGNIYLAGAFRQTITVGAFTLAGDQTLDDDFYDALIVKISNTGSVTWARQIGGAFDDAALSIAIDTTGEPIIGGFYGRSADFDPTKGVYRLQSPDSRNAGYVARFSTTGRLAWAYQFTNEAIQGNERNAVNDLAINASGDIYFAGTFADETDFDPSAARYMIEAEGRNDAYFGKLTRKGAFQWAIPVGGDEEDGFNNIALDAEGNVYTAGYFSDEVDVDPRRNVTNIFTATDEDGGDSPEFPDILVSKWAPDGKPLWQAQMGGGYLETVSDLQIGPDGSVYTVGSFFNVADFAPGRSVVTLSSTLVDDDSIKDDNTDFGRNESYDWYLSRLSPRNGSFIDVAQFGGQDDDFGSTLGITTGGQLLLGGRATTARGDREDRQEQALIYLLDDDLEIV